MHECRFVRNEKSTQELQDKMFNETGMMETTGRENYENTPLGKVLLQHFILDDTETDKSFHFINPYDVRKGGLALVSEKPTTFEEVKNLILEIARDRKSKFMHFYYEAQLFELDSEGNYSLVNNMLPKAF